jgi:TIR domain/Pentapeptide repeats (8 copies)
MDQKEPIPPHSAKELVDRYAAGERQFGLAQLEGADLSGMNLHGSILACANLNGANLQGATLTETNLIEASFIDANLAGVNLSPSSMIGADLFKANLEGAILEGVRLRGSFLVEANFSGARLVDVELQNATLGRTNFSDTMLAFVDFRDVVYASDPSPSSPLANGIPNIVDLAALRKTAKAYSLKPAIVKKHPQTEDAFCSFEALMDFLSHCDLDDEVLDSFKQWTKSGIFHSVFISYSSKDEEFATLLYAYLHAAGVEVWFAPKDMRGGRKIYDQIYGALDSRDKVLLVLSENSIASDWVNSEILKTRDRERKEGRQMLFPIRITEYEKIKNWVAFDADSGHDLAREVRSYLVPDFSNWRDEIHLKAAVKRLLDDLRRD